MFDLHIKTLLSHSYGWKLLPDVIMESDFSFITKTLAFQDPKAKELLAMWYTLDVNALPPVHVLEERRIKETCRYILIYVCLYFATISVYISFTKM